MQLSKHYVQQLRFIQQQKFTLHSSVNILASQLTSTASVILISRILPVNEFFVMFCLSAYTPFQF